MKYYMKFVINKGYILDETVLNNPVVENKHPTGVSVWEFITKTYTGGYGYGDKEAGPIYYAMWDGEKAV